MVVIPCWDKNRPLKEKSEANSESRASANSAEALGALRGSLTDLPEKDRMFY